MAAKKAKKTAPKKAARKNVKRLVAPIKSEVLYMGISNPVDVRRSILECARDMVHFLQMFEKFRVIREEKKEATVILKKQIKELNTLINKFKAALPKTNIRTGIKKPKIEFEAPAEKHEEKAAEKAQENSSEIPDINVDDIEALEAELHEIEDKLNFL